MSIGFVNQLFQGGFWIFTPNIFSHKKDIILSLIDKMILLSHPEFHKENFDCVIKVLLDNGYPFGFDLFYLIRRRLYSMINYKHHNRKEPENILSIFHYFLCFFHR